MAARARLTPRRQKGVDWVPILAPVGRIQRAGRGGEGRGGAGRTAEVTIDVPGAVGSHLCHLTESDRPSVQAGWLLTRDDRAGRLPDTADPGAIGLESLSGNVRKECQVTMSVAVRW